MTYIHPALTNAGGKMKVCVIYGAQVKRSGGRAPSSLPHLTS